MSIVYRLSLKELEADLLKWIKHQKNMISV